MRRLPLTEGGLGGTRMNVETGAGRRRARTPAGRTARNARRAARLRCRRRDEFAIRIQGPFSVESFGARTERKGSAVAATAVFGQAEAGLERAASVSTSSAGRAGARRRARTLG